MESDDLVGELERTGMSAYLKDALAVLLEVRPPDPLLFLSAYFKYGVRQNGDAPTLALYLVRACPRSRPCFRDNLHTAFSVLSRRGGAASSNPPPGSGSPGHTFEANRVSAEDCNALLRLICRSFPAEVSEALLAEARLPSSRPVSFREFVLAIEACLAMEEAAHEVQRLFDICDGAGRGSLSCNELLLEIDRQCGEQIDNCDGSATASVPSFPRAAASSLLPTLVHSADSLRACLSEFDGGCAITADDLFVAMWRTWRENRNHEPPPAKK